MSTDLAPTFYTVQESGRWREWPKKLHIYEKDLERKKLFAVATGSKVIRYEGLTIHSLAFTYPFSPSVRSPRWDAINGWTDFKGAL